MKKLFVIFATLAIIFTVATPVKASDEGAKILMRLCLAGYTDAPMLFTKTAQDNLKKLIAREIIKEWAWVRTQSKVKETDVPGEVTQQMMDDAIKELDASYSLFKRINDDCPKNPTGIQVYREMSPYRFVPSK